MKKIVVPVILFVFLIVIMSFAPKESIPATYAIEVDTVELAGYEFKIPDEATEVIVRESLNQLTWRYEGYFFGLSVEPAVYGEGIKMTDTHLPAEYGETQKYYVMNLNDKDAVKMLVVREGDTNISVDDYVVKFLEMVLE